MANLSGDLLWSFCKNLVDIGAGYVWGARGNVYTTEEADYLYKLYKSNTYDKKYYYTDSMTRWKNKVVVDCSGMIQAFRIKYYDKKDSTADGLYTSCTEKGEISTLPKNEKGVLLFRKSNSTGKMYHVGVYGGEDNTIEAMNSTKGVRYVTPMSSVWTHWGKLPWIDTVKMGNATEAATTTTSTTSTQTTPIDYGKVSATQLNVRIGPGASFKDTRRLSRFAIVPIYEVKNGWARISLGGEWVNKSYLDILTKYTVNTSELNVRNKASASKLSGSKVLSTLKRGAIVYQYGLSTDKKWVKISPTENKYVSISYLKIV